MIGCDLRARDCRDTDHTDLVGLAVTLVRDSVRLAVSGGRIQGFSIAITLFFSSALTTAAEPIDYERYVKPIFAARCTACHGALKQESGLRLDTGALARQGGDGGGTIAPGNSASSILMERIKATDPAERMPQEGEPLTAEQIALIAAWIEQGAKSPADELPDKDPREHWAFRPIARPAVPETENTSWVRNPIDAFVAASHQRQGLTPQVEATRSELLRRLYLDLVGLPPTLEQIKEAETNGAESWYERETDRLLSSSQHGERWARHWMDIWRYSDWWGLGEELRYSQPHIWHWRDWIIESLNANVRYDEMIRSMLAADELYPSDLDKLRATGFLARQYFIFNRNTWLEETVEHVSKGFLGLTMNCAKCHDHKFDPIEQADFYRMRAFFEPYFVRMDSLPTEPDLAHDGIPRAFDTNKDLPTYLFIRGQENDPDKTTSITPDVPEILAFAEPTIKPVKIPLEASQPDRRPWVITSNIESATKRLAAAEAEIVAANDRLAEVTAAAPKTEAADKIAKARAEMDAADCAVTYAAAELISVKSRVEAMKARWARADDTTGSVALKEAERTSAKKAIAAERRATLTKALFAVADSKRRLHTAPAEQKGSIEAELTKAREARNNATKIIGSPIADSDQFTPLVGAKAAATRFKSTLADDETVGWSDQSTGRRKALAEWITDARNPLTARVAVNHIWNRHFGTPLAQNTFDLGRNSPTPTNLELLDWLAAELIESGWDMKHLHRIIVNSATYRMSSSATGREAEVAKDPDNVYVWRRNTIRLESEVVRDTVMSLAGTLDLTMGGPPVAMADQDNSRRRSLYFFHSNNERNLFLTTFDAPLVTECYRRDQSIVPQQALAMTNGRLVLESSRPIADKIAKSLRPDESKVDDDEFIGGAFMVLLGNSPSEAERIASQDAIDAWRKLPDVSAEDAHSYLVWSLLNHNDFITLR
jgi:mono/diheme cytochrome c family protein